MLRILTPELVLSIADFLPPESAASFSLSCTPIYRLLGKHLDALRLDQDARLKFLVILERDLPGNLITCQHCAKFHLIANAHYHHPSERTRLRNPDSLSNDYPATRGKNPEWLRCRIHDVVCNLDLLLHRNFSSTMFRMTMETHRRGQDCSNLLRLLSCEPLPRYRSEQYTGTARIVEGRMLWRNQEVSLSRARGGLWPDEDRSFWICPHLIFHSLKDFTDLQDTSQCLQRCKHCYTEYRVDFKYYGTCRARFITRWKDLGEGGSGDYKWAGYFSGGRREDVKFDPGSVFAAFQQGEPDKFDFLCLLGQEDERILLDNLW